MRRLFQPDPEEVEGEPVYCFGCGRKIGVTPEVKTVVYCEELCWYKNQVINFDNAFRDRAFVYLVEHLGLTKTAVGEAFGVTRPYVFQVIEQGNEGDYLSAGRQKPQSDTARKGRSLSGKTTAAKRARKASTK